MTLDNKKPLSERFFAFFTKGNLVRTCNEHQLSNEDRID